MMTSKRVSIFAGTILGGALLLGTAGLALAQDPTATPSPSVTQGMMSGQSVQGMMGGMDAVDIAAMHRAMGQNGTCDPKLMQSIRDKSGGSRS